MLNKKELELLKQTGVNDKEVTEKLVNFLRHEFDNVVRVTKEDYNKEIVELVDNKQGSYTFIDNDSGDFLAKVSIFNKEVDGENVGLSFIALTKQGWLLTKDDGDPIENILFSDLLDENNNQYGINLVEQLKSLDGKTIATQEWVKQHNLAIYKENDLFTNQTLMKDLKYPCVIYGDECYYIISLNIDFNIYGFAVFNDYTIYVLESYDIDSQLTYEDYVSDRSLKMPQCDEKPEQPYDLVNKRYVDNKTYITNKIRLQYDDQADKTKIIFPPYVMPLKFNADNIDGGDYLFTNLKGNEVIRDDGNVVGVADFITIGGEICVYFELAGEITELTNPAVTYLYFNEGDGGINAYAMYYSQSGTKLFRHDLSITLNDENSVTFTLSGFVISTIETAIDDMAGFRDLFGDFYINHKIFLTGNNLDYFLAQTDLDVETLFITNTGNGSSYHIDLMALNSFSISDDSVTPL